MIKTQFSPILLVGDMQDPDIFWCKIFKESTLTHFKTVDIDGQSELMLSDDDESSEVLNLNSFGSG